MLYENIVKNENIIRKNDRVKIVNHFNDGAYIEILSNVNQKFNVQFFNSFGNLEYGTTINSNSWTKTSKKYFEQYTCRVYQGDTLMYQHIFDASGKRVYIILDSKSLGDTIAWIPYVEEFRKKMEL